MIHCCRYSSSTAHDERHSNHFACHILFLPGGWTKSCPQEETSSVNRLCCLDPAPSTIRQKWRVYVSYVSNKENWEHQWSSKKKIGNWGTAVMYNTGYGIGEPRILQWKVHQVVHGILSARVNPIWTCLSKGILIIIDIMLININYLLSKGWELSDQQKSIIQLKRVGTHKAEMQWVILVLFFQELHDAWVLDVYTITSSSVSWFVDGCWSVGTIPQGHLAKWTSTQNPKVQRAIGLPSPTRESWS